jgi:hypothetical protein
MVARAQPPEYTAEEIAKRRDDAIHRALNTPATPIVATGKRAAAQRRRRSAAKALDKGK